MRRNRLARIAVALIGLVFVCTGMSAAAQDTRCRIIDLRLRSVRTPQFRGSRYGSEGSDGQWLEAYVEYETDVRRGEWTDELTVEWALLVRPGERRPLLLKESVTYLDVEEGEHHAVIYLRPSLIKRYTNQSSPKESDFAVYVEISAGGQRLARASESRDRQPDNWWQATEPNVQILQNALLTRLQTPFAHMDYDYYEYIKPKR